MKADKFAAISAGVVFLAGMLLAILFHNVGVKDSATIIIALLLVPLLTYGIATGKILELSGPGGLKVKLQELAQQRVATSATVLTDERKELQKVEKKGPDEIKEIVQQLEKGKPVALILEWGKKDYYQTDFVKDYIQTLSQFDPETIVVLVDSASKRFVTMIDANSFLGLWDKHANELLQAIEQKNMQYLRQFPQFLWRGIPESASQADALKEMNALNARTLVVLSASGEPQAIVKREEIVAHMLEKLAST